jgi:NitT/TauT family transport system permease protein
MASKRNLDRWAPWIFLAALLLLWELGVRAFRIDEFILPSASSAFKALYDNFWPIMKNTWPTFWTTMVGFGIGIVVGVVLGVIIGSSRFMYNGLYPLLVAFNAIPKAAFVPILIVWFGIGVFPATLTAFLICFFPITVNVATGLATIEPELEDVLRALGATRKDVLVKVGLPRSMPYFFASLKVAITLAFVGSVISEMVAANEGIGQLMLAASSTMRVPLMFAGLIVISVMAMVMYQAFALLERRMTGWATRGMNTPG